MRGSRCTRRALAALVAVLASSLPGAALTSIPEILDEHVASQAILTFRADAPPAVRRATLRGLDVVDRNDAIGAVLVRVPGAVAKALPSLRRLPGVADAEPNLVGRVTAAPPPSRANDPLVAGIGPTFQDRQWYLQRINAFYAWTVYPQTYYTSRTKPGIDHAVKVAVLDTMIDNEHHDWRNAGGGSPSSALGGQIDLRDQKSFVAANQLGGPVAWHGTYVAGIIAAAADNATDMAGIAYSAQIMPVTVARGTDGTTDAWTVGRGVTWATDRGAKVINVSLTVVGSHASVTALRNAINRAVTRGSVIVAAAGNTDSDDAEFPGGFAAENPGVIAVGSSDVFDQRHAGCSKKGRHLSVLAPDQLVWGLDPQDHSDSRDPSIRRETCGTSFATPIVSGVAALVAGKYGPILGRGITPREINLRIQRGADDLGTPGRDDETGAGRVNAERALWPGGGGSVKWDWPAGAPTAGPSNKIWLRARSWNAVQAEVLVNGAQRGRGIKLNAPRGANKAFTVALDTSKLTEGPHEVHIRTRDARGVWGPAASGVFIVDRTPPRVPAPFTFPRDTSPAVNPDDARAAIMFSAFDDWSRTLEISVALIDAKLDQVVKFEWKGARSLPANHTFSIPWASVEKAYGGPLLPGLYRIIVNAKDLGGQVAYPYGDTPFVLLPSPRLLPKPGETQTNGPIPVIPTTIPTTRPSPTVSPTPSASPPSAPTAAPSTPGMPSSTPTPFGATVSPSPSVRPSS